jgi:hypothetical protein
MLSLLIFVLFVVLIFLAYFSQRRGEYYFRERPTLNLGIYRAVDI